MAIAIPFFQQLTEINIVAFYSPNLFHSIGMGNNGALLSALGLVNLAYILVSTALVDRLGRRFLFIMGGLLMLLCQVSKLSNYFFCCASVTHIHMVDTNNYNLCQIVDVTTLKIAVSALLAVVTGVHGAKEISKGNAILVLVLLCFYSAGFGWSWGPLNWLIPSEIFPLKIRSTGQSIAVGLQFIILFVLSQTFLTMLCVDMWHTLGSQSLGAILCFLYGLLCATVAIFLGWATSCAVIV